MKEGQAMPAEAGSLRRALKVDLHRSVISSSFALTVMILILWLAMNSAQYLTSETFLRFCLPESIVNYATTSASTFSSLVLVIAAIPYAWSYCQDKDSGFLIQAEQRIGLRIYGLSRVFSVAVSAFLAAVLAMGLFTVFVHTQFRGEESRESLANTLAYMTLVAEGNTGLYYLIRFTVTGLTCSMGAVLGLMITAYFPSVYLAYLMPLMAYYFWEIAGPWAEFGWYHLVRDILCLSEKPNTGWLSAVNVLFWQPLPDDIPAFFLAAGELLALITLFGFLFCRKLRKEQSE